LRRQRHRVGGIAFKYLDRYRTAIGGTQQTVDDLQFALLAVARVAEARQLAASAFKPGRGDVVEHQRPGREVAAGERGLDRALAGAEPVEGAVELDFVDRTQPEQPTQARGGGGGGQLACGGELGGGRDQAAGNQRHRQWRQALVGRLAEQPVETNRPDRAQHRGGVTVRQRAADADAVRSDGDAALQQRAKTLDQRGRPSGEIGQGALSDPAILAKALAQQDGGRRAAIGYRFDVHGAI